MSGARVGNIQKRRDGDTVQIWSPSESEQPEMHAYMMGFAKDREWLTELVQAYAGEVRRIDIMPPLARKGYDPKRDASEVKYETFPTFQDNVSDERMDIISDAIEAAVDDRFKTLGHVSLPFLRHEDFLAFVGGHNLKTINDPHVPKIRGA